MHREPTTQPVPPTSRGRRRLAALSLGIVGLLVVDQVALRTVLADDELLGHRVAPFSPPLFSGVQVALLERLEHDLSADRAAYERETTFDAELGWCPPASARSGGMTFDWAGSRLGPEPVPKLPRQVRLVALVGCSFTLGNEVDDSQTWAHRLDERVPGTRFGNFGVGGYGPDQALLRYRRDVVPLEPDEVWLGWFPHSILRASSHFPPLYHRWRARTVYFKPRFALGPEDEVLLRPSPTATPDDAVRLMRDPAAFVTALADDPWVARARAAYLPDGSHWLHRSALGRVALTLHERRGRDVPGRLVDPEDDLHRLGLAIVRELRDEVEARGGRFRLLILPARGELEQVASGRGGYWTPLVDRLVDDGIEVFDPTSELAEAGVGEREGDWMPGGHYGPRTNDRLAEAIERRWFP